MNNVDRQGLTEGEVIEILQQFEMEQNLLQYEVDGWCLWPLLRFDVEMTVVNLPLSKKEKFSLAEQLLFAVRDIPAFLRLRNCKYVLKTYSSAMYEDENGLFKDAFFDDLFSGTPDVFRIEEVNHKALFLKRVHAKYPAQITSLAVKIAAGVLALVPWIAPDFSITARQLSRLITEKFQIEDFSYKRILRKARFFFWGKRIYRALLGKLHAQAVITADPGEYLIAAAAKELSIPVIEFEHGLISRDYNSFYSWSAYARPYKKHMPISDKICLFGDYWKDDLLAGGFWDQELVVTGRIFLDEIRRKRQKTSNEYCRIVLTTQGLEHENLITWIREFQRQAESDPEFKYHLFIKMHPIYDYDQEFFIKEFSDSPSITIVGAAEKPTTFDLLVNADFHWSISSTCHFDALGLGVPTVIIKLQTHETLIPLYKKGAASLASSGRELSEITRKWQKVRVPDQIREYFYKSNALENARKEVGLT